MRTTVLIVAAGSGSRLKAGVPKALAPLADGRTLLEHCLESVAAAQAAGVLELNAVAVVLPADPEAAAALEQVCRAAGDRAGFTVRCVPGGAERADSVRAGLAAVRALADAEPAAGADTDAEPGAEPGADDPDTPHAVLVHDAARPFVPVAVFQAVATALGKGAAAVVPAVPVVDTIKTVTGAAPGPEWVSGTLDRAGLRAVQTPQGFDLTALEAAHRRAGSEVPAGAAALTDDAMAMEAAGHPVELVPGDPLGFKITTRLDLMLANALLAPAAAALSPQEQHP
ncbi:IspD/TarI family cytidylyltransferase [Citricoccus sp. NPDC055426]|uniref:IspD/TarI family cytidylyltransferase n=1 Tax=Citricoccus sp. NPDC055426 TaxID=3155536 RepID=UPI0034341CE3